MNPLAALMLRKYVLLATIFLLAAALPGHAIVIIGNSQDSFVNRPIGPSGPLNFVEAVGFTMPGQNYTLTDIRLTLVFYDGPSQSVVSIYNDNAGEPGSLYALLNDDPNPIPDFDAHQYTFTPSGTVLLAANTSYWVVLASEGDPYAWRQAQDAPTGVAAFDGFLLSSDGGSSWVGDFNFLITINGELAGTPSVPDAGSTLLLMAMSLLGVACACRTCLRAN